MSLFAEWADNIAAVVSAESVVVGDAIEHGGERGSAREMLVRNVLDRILPDTCQVGFGEIVDSVGGRSNQIDVIVARGDFPVLRQPHGGSVFLLESVLATIEVKSRLTKTTLTDALDNCMSVSLLNPRLETDTLASWAEENGYVRVGEGNWQHESDPLKTAQFDVSLRPASYVYGFDGYRRSVKDMAGAFEAWATPKSDLALRHYPAVVASAGCWFWRNAQPYPLVNNVCGIFGIDENPLRLLIMHLLDQITRRMPPLPDVRGLRHLVDQYIQDMGSPGEPMGAIGETFHQESGSSS